MNDEAALRAAIDASPLEDTPRLVLADYLDETDRPQEAFDERFRVALKAVCARFGLPPLTDG